jgi:pimeloyl-ACP methyl ester carboxylesterase
VADPTRSTQQIAHDRAGPRGETPVLLVHAGVADRRMWEPLWKDLTAERDVVRLDLRGFGESTSPPAGGVISHVDDVLGVLDEEEIAAAHVVGASYGTGVSVEVALTRPEAVRSLLLSAPAGSLLATLTPHLSEFFEAERTALEAGDLDAAVAANLATWVDGPHRAPGTVDSSVRELVRDMQRRAFEITADWDVDEVELDPPALERLDEIRVPTLALVGDLDLDTVHDAAERVVRGVAGARRVDWTGVGHLPSLERPDDFLALLRDWLGTA